MNRKGEGSIFNVRRDAQFTPPELVRYLATDHSDERWTIDADDPIEFLRHVETIPLAIIRQYECQSAGQLSWVTGVGASHSFRMPSNPTAVMIDAIDAISELGILYRRIGKAADGGIAVAAMKIGFKLATIHVRNHEHDAYVGESVGRNLVSGRPGKPITKQAEKLFSQGAGLRKVAADCNVGYQVARRWKKVFENR